MEQEICAKLLCLTKKFSLFIRVKSYHGLMLGLLAMTDNRYKIFSNGESGDGLYDICLIPQQNNLPGIIIELKAVKKYSAEDLKRLASDALIQIKDKHYDTRLLQSGITNILNYGVSFSGKHAEVAMSASNIATG